MRVAEASHRGPPRQGFRAASVPKEALDDLEVVLTRIDSSGTDDEPLVLPLSGPRRSTTEGSQGGGRLRRLRVVSFSLHGALFLSFLPW